MMLIQHEEKRIFCVWMKNLSSRQQMKITLFVIRSNIPYKTLFMVDDSGNDDQDLFDSYVAPES
jgi:hypothetical protein